MSDTDVYVVVYGDGGCIDDIHGVFMHERRAEVATEELARVYDDPGEFASVQAHELITDYAEDR